MLSRLILAVVVGVVTSLVCVLVGSLLVTIGVDIAVTVGNFLKQWAGAIGLLSALWYFFSGQSWPNNR